VRDGKLTRSRPCGADEARAIEATESAAA
jgi:hypothetical protein